MVSHNYQPLLVLDKSSPNFPEDLCAVISREDFDGYISTHELGGIIDYLDEVPCLRWLQLSPTKPAVGPG